MSSTAPGGPKVGVQSGLNVLKNVHLGPMGPVLPWKPATPKKPIETPVQQDLQKVDVGEIRRLHGMMGAMTDAANGFVLFVREARGSGKSLGLETLASEVGLLNGDEHMGRLRSALGRAVSKGEPAALSQEGFSKMRRLEGLLGDASIQLDQRLGQPTSVPKPLISILVFGAIALGIVLVVSRS